MVLNSIHQVGGSHLKSVSDSSIADCDIGSTNVTWVSLQGLISVVGNSKRKYWMNSQAGKNGGH